jgi:flavodoxin
MGGPPGKMKKFLKKLNVEEKSVKYALMTTQMDPNAKTLEKMQKILEPKGMTKVTPGLHIKVEGMKGPLEEGYEKKIEEFASQILNI